MRYAPRVSLCSILFAALLFAACGSSKDATDLTPRASDKTIEQAPDWFLETPEDPNYLFATATSTSRDMQVAVNKAQTTARGQIAEQLETKFEGLTKQFQEEVGVGDDSELLEQYTQAYKSVVSQVLHGSSTRERHITTEGGIYRAYVLMEMPIGEASQALMSQLEANRDMYTRFRASQTFEELQQEVERYERWKEEQRTGQARQEE